ncbi:GrpB family protein [Macrococcus carouselicus]|uniref:GrpB family protein n=1 Tax=Macrococcus carouselicus TaxID=69969 RepID=A0A9Q8CL30_9STAP|nr:GrpB family protein [Macrococcus carouselicus]TDM00786.1 GrpB family protein [Macrococcus carouselicus]
MRRVNVIPYDSIWQHLYLGEVQLLKGLFEDELIEIHHIGSTAVPGLAAKPIIDILLVVKKIDHVDILNGQLEAIGYKTKGENGIKGRRYFEKGGMNRTHHLHVYQENNDHIRRHLAFRDYLRNFSGEAERYGQLKMELAKLYPFDIDSYIAGKDIFVRVVEVKAINWYDRKSGEKTEKKQRS